MPVGRRPADPHLRGRRLILRRFALVLAAGVVVGCGGPTPSSVTASATGTPSAAPGSADPATDRVAGWRSDIDRLLVARDDIHPDGWHGMERATWIAEADAGKSRIPDLTDEQALVELVRLAAMPGWSGRDGHTGIVPVIGGAGTHVYPVRSWRFPEGLVITDADAAHADLLGWRIEAIDGVPADEVLDRLEPLVPRDNPASLRSLSTAYLRVSELLVGLGIVATVGPATFSVVDVDGTRRDVAVDAVPVREAPADHANALARMPAGEPLWLRNDDDPISWTELADSRTGYVGYRAMLGDPSQVAAELLERARDGALDRVVVDLRRNPGGNNTTYGPVLRALQDPAIDREGRLYVLVGRTTFSAATNFVVDLERSTTAVFVGETMGGSPMLYGDPRPVGLRQSGQRLFMATRRWDGLTPDDDRLAKEPDIAVELTWADWLAGRDPVLDAVVALP